MSKPKHFSLSLPTLIQRSIVFEESLIKIRRDKLQIGEQLPYDYYSVLTPPMAVAILATTPEGAYVLTQEYRHPTGHILLGCPGGYIDSGENPIEAAQRELMEETGFQAQSFTIMGSAFPYAGFSGQQTIYIQAVGATLFSQPCLEISEIICHRLLQREELKQEIKNGIELDGNLCTALFFHQLY